MGTPVLQMAWIVLVVFSDRGANLAAFCHCGGHWLQNSCLKAIGSIREATARALKTTTTTFRWSLNFQKVSGTSGWSARSCGTQLSFYWAWTLCQCVWHSSYLSVGHVAIVGVGCVGGRLVVFYAPWCTHCKSMVSDFKGAATAMEGVVEFGAMNAETHKNFVKRRFRLSAYPTFVSSLLLLLRCDVAGRNNLLCHS